MLATPVILGNGALLTRAGTEGFQIGVPVVLTLQSTTGYTSFAWTLLRGPSGTAATLGTPTTFASSLTADLPGDYLIKGRAVGPDGTVSALAVAIIVRTPNRALRKIDDQEEFVANVATIRTAYNALTDAADTTRVGRAAVVMATDANRTVTTTEAKGRFLDVSSGVSLTAQRDLVIDPTTAAASGDPWWFVRNNTTGAQALNVRTAAGGGVIVAAGATKAVCYDGSTGMVG